MKATLSRHLAYQLPTPRSWRHLPRYILIGWVLAGALVAMSRGVDAAPAAHTFRDCPSCPQMVVVPAGSFTMGSNLVLAMKGGELRTEGPIHEVRIARAFAAGKFEVTNSEFAAFVAATGYHPASECSVSATEMDMISFSGPLFGVAPAPQAPVVCVSWNDAVTYTAWLSGKTGKRYRLLSEAEWEYAARAGTSTKWPWGDDDIEACRHENIYDLDGEANPPDGNKLPWPSTPCHDGHATLAPVGSYPANPFGLHDMLGNAWEWVEDCTVQPYPASPVDGSPVEVSGVCPKRSVRGASWYSRIERHSPTFRGADLESTSSHQFGFRVARDL